MTSITVRNIPDDVIDKIKSLSVLEKRSLNNQILMLIEDGLNNEINATQKEQFNLSKAAQIDIWEKICGKWEDNRTTEEIINDIVSNRTIGREVKL